MKISHENPGFYMFLKNSSFTFRFTFPMTPYWSCKANGLVDKVCKLTLTLCPSLSFDLFRLPGGPPDI